jgi:hypothetical protein
MTCSARPTPLLHCGPNWTRQGLLLFLAGCLVLGSRGATPSPLPEVAAPWRDNLTSLPVVELSNETLPAHVRPVPGRLTLFADYSDSVPGGTVLVYLINASPSDVVLETQNGDPFLKLERLNEYGGWQRAQHHAIDTCAWAFGTKRLLPGRSLRYKGYQPRSGSIEPVRYALYNQAFSLGSNAGWGRVNHREARFAFTDDLAVLHGDHALLEAVVTGQVPSSIAARLLARQRLDGEPIRLRIFSSN